MSHCTNFGITKSYESSLEVGLKLLVQVHLTITEHFWTNICTFRVKFIENRADLCKSRENPGFEKIETRKNPEPGFL